MFTINIVLAILILIFFFAGYPLIIIFALKNNLYALKIVSAISFFVYLLFISLLVFGEVSINGSVFTVQLKFDNEWFSLNFCVASFSSTNIIYNMVMMFPVSAFIIGISKTIALDFNGFKNQFKNIFFKTVVYCFLISFAIEIFQFVLPINRTTEVLDLFTNTLSGVLGCVFFCGAILIYKKVQEKK